MINFNNFRSWNESIYIWHAPRLRSLASILSDSNSNVWMYVHSIEPDCKTSKEWMMYYIDPPCSVLLWTTSEVTFISFLFQNFLVPALDIKIKHRIYYWVIPFFLIATAITEKCIRKNFCEHIEFWMKAEEIFITTPTLWIPLCTVPSCYWNKKLVMYRTQWVLPLN